MFPSKSRKFERIRELAEYQDSMGFGLLLEPNKELLE
jgi:hypothetical protein